MTNYSDFQLSTDHPASSHGIPVLIGPDGKAYGPMDAVPLDGREVRAWRVAETAASYGDLQLDAAQAFASHPDVAANRDRYAHGVPTGDARGTREAWYIDEEHE